MQKVAINKHSKINKNSVGGFGYTYIMKKTSSPIM